MATRCKAAGNANNDLVHMRWIKTVVLLWQQCYRIFFCFVVRDNDIKRLLIQDFQLINFKRHHIDLINYDIFYIVVTYTF